MQVITDNYQLKEEPHFDDTDLYLQFKEWHQRVAEERHVLFERIKGIEGNERRSEYVRFYQNIGRVSNDFFNSITDISNPDER